MPRPCFLRTGKGCSDTITPTSSASSLPNMSKVMRSFRVTPKRGKPASSNRRPSECKQLSKSKILAASQEVRMLKRTTHFLFTKSSFQRVVRGAVERHGGNFRFSPASLAALQDATEAYTVGIFEVC